MSLQAGQLSGLVIGLISTAVVSRLLGPEKYGVLALFLAVAQFAVIVGINWTSSAVIRFGKEEFLRTGAIRRVFWTRLVVIAPWLVVEVAALYLGQKPFLSLTGLSSEYLTLVIAMMLVLVLADQTDGSLQAVGQWNRYAWRGTVEKVTFLVGLLLIGLLFESSPVGIVVVLAVAASLARIIFGGLPILRQPGLVLPPIFDQGMLRRILKYSWPQIFVFTLGYASAFVEPFLIKWYFGIGKVGIYQVAYQMNLFFVAVLAPIPTLLFPLVTSLIVQNREDLEVWCLARTIPQFVFAMNIVIVLTMVGVTLIFRPLLGDAYSDGLTPLLILLSSASFQVITMLYSPFLAAYELTKESAAVNCIGGLVVHFLPEVILISWWGINGAAASWLIWYVFSASVYVWVINKQLSTRQYSVLTYPLMAIACLLILLIFESLPIQVGLSLGLILAALSFAKWQRVFCINDLVVFDATNAPPLLRRIAAKAYALL
jgi:O-antigen/teichoic acid export membrane protein